MIWRDELGLVRCRSRNRRVLERRLNGFPTRVFRISAPGRRHELAGGVPVEPVERVLRVSRFPLERPVAGRRGRSAAFCGSGKPLLSIPSAPPGGAGLGHGDDGGIFVDIEAHESMVRAHVLVTFVGGFGQPLPPAARLAFREQPAHRGTGTSLSQRRLHADIVCGRNTMTPKEEAGFRAVYAESPTERLARAVKLEKKDYQPEAVVLMLEELKKRGVEEEGLPAFVAALPPPQIGTFPEKDTFFFPARLDRIPYLIRWIVSTLVAIVAMIISEVLPQVLQVPVFIALCLASMIYTIRGLYIPRIKNAGYFSLFLFLLFVPIANVGVLLFLFFAPPKK